MGRAFTPEQLAADFGRGSEIARRGIAALYGVLHPPVAADAAVGLAQWSERFAEIWGRAASAVDPGSAKLAAHLGLSAVPQAPLLCAVQSYYALVLQALAERIAASQSPLTQASAGPAEPLAFALAACRSQAAAVLAELTRALAAYDAATLGGPSCRDLVKRLYESLFPKTVRRALGEFYTPDWLAEFTLDEVGYTGDPEQRLLDPACGSGTFLVLAIARARAWFAAHRDRCGYDPSALAGKLLRNLAGFDKNPLAVLAARTNFLLALRDLLPASAQVAPPIWLCDSILAPADCGRFDVVVGNPPWINWESLPPSYRQQTAHLFRDYQLLTLKGWKARVAAGRTDLSILFVLTCLQTQVQRGGRLAFVINQSIFQSAGGGEGLRRFRLREAPFAPLCVHDFSAATLFPDAVTRAAVAVFARDTDCRYPVPYIRWQPSGRQRLLLPEAARALPAHCRRIAQQAVPASAGNPQSAWLTGSAASLRALTKLLGTGAYRAREGINWGGALGVFQLAAAQFDNRGHCHIKNDPAAGRVRVEPREAEVEAALVYPLVKGRDVRCWQAELGRHVLLSHPAPTAFEPADDTAAAKAIPLSTMQRRYPQALSYFSAFRPLLEARKEYQRWGGTAPFYELYRIGPYTFAPFKVVFKDLSELFQCCVVTSAGPYERQQVIIADYTLRVIACDSADEAYFVAGLLNSKPARLALHATAVGVQTRRYHASDIERLALPRYAPAAPPHILISELSRRCHAAAGRPPDLADLAAAEHELDAAVARLWELSAAELRQIQGDFASLSKTRSTKS